MSMNKQLIVDPSIEEQIKAHAENDYPNECCGFFFGTNETQRIVTKMKIVTNAKKGNQRRRFEISPKDYQKAETYALEHDLDLLGVYHSHPDHPAEPSEHDRSVALPYFSYIIVSVRKGQAAEVRSWKLNDVRAFEEEEIQFTEELKQQT